MDFVLNNLAWLIPAAAVLLCLIFGFRDVLQFSLVRTMAIAGVCFRESLRRRVLYVIPLAVAGVLLVSLFQRPIDEMDAIRQMITFSLFATGMLVVILGIILACSNLPREIDNRVIYTIVTKPTTRLEIVLGKVVGFAGLSALVLLIMGVFTFGYLQIQSARMQAGIAEKLAMGPDAIAPLTAGERASLEYYQKFGLLSARKLEMPTDIKVLAERPRDGAEVYWFRDITMGDVLIPFRTNEQVLSAVMSAAAARPAGQDLAADAPRLALVVDLYHRPVRGGGARAVDRPMITPFVDPTGDGRTAVASIALYNRFGELLLDDRQMGAENMALRAGGGPSRLVIPVPERALGQMMANPLFTIRIAGLTETREFGLGRVAAQILAVRGDGSVIADGQGQPLAFGTEVDPLDPSRQRAVFRGRQGGRGGMQLAGAADGSGPVALMQFRDTAFAHKTEATGVELHMAVERTGDETMANIDTVVEARFYNHARPGAEPVVVTGAPENNRLLFLPVPAEAVAGGNFDLVIRCLTAGHWVTVSPGDVQIVSDRQPFALNLALSLSILWMMSVLVTSIAVFTSTFLSWPIAVVLTLVLLSGRWMVEQLGDSLGAGIGNEFVMTMGVRGAAESQAISKSVEALAALLRTAGSFLPDISAFAAMHDIGRGMRIPLEVLAGSGLMLVVFALPAIALAYVFLKYQEVAP